MAGATQQFYLAYFDYGDTLSAPLNVSLEVDRFTLIDRQLFAMATIFGNGVINGWTVTQGTDPLSVDVSPGIGLIQGMASETLFSEELSGLSPNMVTYVYIDRANDTPEDRTTRFILSTDATDTTGLLLASVTTSGQAITAVNNNPTDANGEPLRATIGFQQLIADAVAHHRHGATCDTIDPNFALIEAPRIDLTQEVQGLLPVSHMANITPVSLRGDSLQPQ